MQHARINLACNLAYSGNNVINNWKQDAIGTYEVCKDCEHSDLPQVINICHPLYLDQVAKGIHTDHLSVNHCLRKYQASVNCIELWQVDQKRKSVKKGQKLPQKP